MEGFAPVRAGSRIAGLASLLFASASVAAGTEPDISGIWWAATYSRKSRSPGAGLRR